MYTRDIWFPCTQRLSVRPQVKTLGKLDRRRLSYLEYNIRPCGLSDQKSITSHRLGMQAVAQIASIGRHLHRCIEKKTQNQLKTRFLKKLNLRFIWRWSKTCSSSQNKVCLSYQIVCLALMLPVTLMWAIWWRFSSAVCLDPYCLTAS